MEERVTNNDDIINNTLWNSKPLISVIIPVYNGEKFISDTVKNILKSTYCNIEVLLINDGSKDNSSEVCRQLVESDKRVKYFYKENGGIASARNFGIENANGDYIAFSDQDDLCKVDIYECLLSDILSSGCDFVVSNYASFTENINTLKVNNIIEENISLNKKDIYELQKYLLFNTVLNSPKLKIPEMVWNCLFKVEFIKHNKIKFFRFVNYEDDWLFLLQCLQYADNVYLDKDYFYYWRIHNNSESHSLKYIENAYQKYVNLTGYLDSYIQNTLFTEAEKADYLSFRGVQNILGSCVQEIRVVNNYKTYKSAKKICKEIVKKEKARIKNKKIYRKYDLQGRRYQIYLNLLRYNCYFVLLILEKRWN